MNNREIDAAVAEKIFGMSKDEIEVRMSPLSSPLLKSAGVRGIDPIPEYSQDIAAAWTVVEHMRDQWTEATDGVSGFDDSFVSPFDDVVFFEKLHRNADRRWPWAFLYVTPLAICEAALAAVET